MHVELEQLQDRYNKSPEIAAICDELGNRSRNRKETKFNSFFTKINYDRSERIQRPRLIAAFRELQQIGCGEYVPGRHGHPSRFVWNKEYGSLSIRRAAFGEELSPAQELLSEDEDMTYEEEQVKSEEELLYHHFNLRVDYQLEFTLPVDLTICEAERLSAFIKCLPLEDF